MAMPGSSFPNLLSQLVAFFIFISSILSPTICAAQNDTDEREIGRKLAVLPWVKAPNEGSLGGIATVNLTRDIQFLGTSATNQFLQLNGNLPNENSYTLAKTNLAWFSIFNFKRSGYVKDDEQIDPDALLEQLQKNNVAANEERKKQGLQLLYLERWFVPPHYDRETNQLEWGTQLRSEHGEIIMNYTTRLLGRSGVMSVILVSDPDNLDHEIIEFKSALKAFTFNPGEKYTEFKQGDKVAEYGLAALVLGGAAAAAAKSGAGKAIFKGLGFLILGGVAAIWALLKKIFQKKE